MGRKDHAAAKADVRPDISLPTADIERVATIREWLASKAKAVDDPVAGLALTILSSGKIDIAMRGIEIEFVDDLIEQMTDLIGALSLWKDAKIKPEVRHGNVVRLTRFNIE